MNSPESPSIVGVFKDETDARRAMSDLEALDIDAKQVAYQMQYRRVESPEKAPDEYGSDIGRGLLGAAAASFVPGIGPALAAGILTATTLNATPGTRQILASLRGMGIAEDDVGYFEREARSGRTLVIVQAGTRSDEVRKILRKRGAYDIEGRGA